MIDSELVFKFKKKFGNIYAVDIKNVTVIFRELTFKEYNQVLYYQELDGSSYTDVEDLILTLSIIYPENFDVNRIPPGNVSTLAQDILDLSGITSAKIAKQTLDFKREEVNEVKNLMKAFVLAAFNAYSPDDLEDMTFSELAEKVALAEKVIEIKQGINGLQSTELKLQLIDPEEEALKEKTRAARHNLSKKEGEAAYEDPIAQKLWGMR
jgi:hypothetical protein